MQYALLNQHSNKLPALDGFRNYIQFFGLKIGALIGLVLQIAFFIPMTLKRTYTILEAFSPVFFVILAIGFLILGEQSIENSLDGQLH
jgi:hypothetical protein